MKKSRIIYVLIVIAVAMLLTACTTSDEPCAYCSESPTKKYTTANDTECYICEDCSSECFLCGEKAKKHYTNLLDIEVFVCNDCYDDVTAE